MKKLPTLLLISFLYVHSFAQMEVGYNTMDIGGEFQWYKDGKYIGFHMAVNAKLHHSIHGTVGYYIAGSPTANFYNNETNGGIGFGLGYRYYTRLRPHAFFVGVNAKLFTHEISLNTTDPETYSSLIFIPSLEAGYMLLINDLLFITPTVAAGYKTNLRSELKQDEKKIVGLLGISCGFKF